MKRGSIKHGISVHITNAQVVEQIDFRIATIKLDKGIKTYLHMQLTIGVSEEPLSHYYSLLDTEERKLIVLN